MRAGVGLAGFLALVWWAVPQVAPAESDATPLEDFFFDQGDGGFKSVSESGNFATWTWDTWETPPPEVGPGIDNSLRDGAWITRRPGPYTTYLNGWLVHLVSPGVVIPSGGATLELHHYYDTQAGGDGGIVGLRVGEETNPWQALIPPGGYPGTILYGSTPTAAYSGFSGGWTRSYFDLSSFADQNVYLDLFFYSNYNQEEANLGWLVERALVWPGDRVPPELEVTRAPADTDNFLEPYEVVVMAGDPGGANNLNLSLRWLALGPGGVSEEGQGPLTFSGAQWVGSITAQPPDTRLTWYAEARDAAGNLASDPERALIDEAARYSFTVALRPPGPPLPVGDIPFTTRDLSLRWDLPATEMVLMGSRLYVSNLSLVEGDAPDDQHLIDTYPPDETSATVTLSSFDQDGPVFLALTTLYDDGGGLPLESRLGPPTVLSVQVPSLVEVSPSVLYQGQTVTLDIRGQNTDFAAGHVTATLEGQGVDIPYVEVLDVFTLRATVVVDAQAQLGDGLMLEVLVDGHSRGTWPMDLKSGELRPAILGAQPNAAAIGTTVEVDFVARSINFNEDTPSVDFGPGITPIGQVKVSEDGSTFTQQIRVEASAAQGERPVLVSTSQLFVGVPFLVRGSSQTIQSCDSGGRSGAEWACLVILLGLSRRRVAHR